MLTKSTIKDVFKACGASPEHIEAFEEKFDESFGEEAQITPTNIVDTKHFEVRQLMLKFKLAQIEVILLKQRL